MINLLEQLDLENILLDELKTYDLEFTQIRDNFTENFKFEKPFVSSLCELLLRNNKFPTQKEFRQYYIYNNKEYLKHNFLKTDSRFRIIALISRLNRAYPSLIRDLHFAILLKKKTSLNVFYNDEFDYKQGIDILINDTFALRLFVNTKTSYSNRYKKDYRREYNQKYTYIDVPITMSNDKLFGKFYLYNEDDIDDIKKHINI